MKLKLPDAGTAEITLHCVFKYGIRINLFSLGDAERIYGIWWSSKDKLVRNQEDIVIGYTADTNNVPILQIQQAAGLGMISAELAHQRMGHAGALKSRLNQGELGEPVDYEAFNCEACKLAKSKRIVSHDRQARASKARELFHVDLQPVKPPGQNLESFKIDINHAMVVTDDASRYRFVMFLRSKHEALQHL